ncbi:MAG: hypothetical protein COB13_010195 [OCS116 cluster bacterium]|nr:hypothetical protein [OCS116 cluster bacterium]
MSKNLEVVAFFIAEFYENNSTDMAALTAPAFSFTQNSGSRQNFGQFVRRMRFLNHSAKYEIKTPTSQNDTHFYSQFEVQIPNGNAGFITGLGRVELVIEDGLVQAIDISYHKTQEEYEKFQTSMNESRVAFV